jgi:hypothetical protein
LEAADSAGEKSLEKRRRVIEIRKERLEVEEESSKRFFAKLPREQARPIRSLSSII